MKKKTTEYNVVIERDSDGYYIGTVSALPGCHTQAKSLDQLIVRIKEAIQLCKEVYKADGADNEFVGVQKVLV